MLTLLKRIGKKGFLYLCLIIALIAGQTYFDLLIPDYMAEVTALVQTPGTNINNILINGGYMLLAALASLVLAVITGYFIANYSSIIAYNIRSDLFKKILNLSQGDIDEFTPSSLITRTTNDVSQVEMFVGFGTMIIIKSPVMAIWAISKIIGKGFEWTMAMAVSIAVMIVIMIILIKTVVPKFSIIQKSIDDLNLVSRENLTGIRVVRAFNAETYQKDKISKVNEKLTKVSKQTQKIYAIIMPMIFFNMHLLTLAIYIIGAGMITSSSLPVKIETFGNMIVFSSYAMQVIISFLMLGFLVVMYSRSQISSKRINEVFDADISIKDGDINVPADSQVLEFKNVSFKYPDAQENILNNICFTAKKGETVAFIGQTGSGKSTVVNLIPRMYEATQGEILIDGVNINDMTMERLNNKIGFVPQEAVMFSMSVADNTRFGRSAKNIEIDDIKEAIEVAQGKDFVEKLDDQYDYMVARGGTNLSGGQKQRLSIARAIARKPSIYIFDDTFSALDFKTEATLRKELSDFTKNAISLLVSSRVGSVMSADKIILLENGRMVGQGSHKELWESNDLYREIALSQLSEEEIYESIK